MFTQEEIQKLLEIVDYHSSFLVGSVLGNDILTEWDKYVLKQHGIDVDEILKYKDTPYFEMYMFGKLSSQLQNNTNVNKIDYNDFAKYIKQGQYIPLTRQEKINYDVARQTTYGHIKGLGDRIKRDITGTIVESSATERTRQEKIIAEEIKQGVKERKTVKDIISGIGHQVGSWEKDWGRIVETEMNNIFQQGRAEQLLNEKGGEVRVFKEVYPKACRHCIRLYLTNGVGSQPREFSLGELIGNGTNYGKKVADWKPVIESTHPFCRCMLRSIPDGYVWSDEEGRYVREKKEHKVKRKSKVTVTVGDKKFVV